VTPPLDDQPLRAGERPAWADRDVELLRQALGGDPQAVEVLCGRLTCVPRMVQGLNARMNRPLGGEDQRDLCQQVLALVWRKLPQFDGQAAFEAWVLGIVRFELLNAARSLRRRPESGDEQALEHTAARSVEPGVDRERIWIALQRMDRGDSQIIRWYLFDECSFEEIAARIGASVSAAKNRYYRALQGLRVRLGGMAPRRSA
jgi:RNA polymerase sigma-70 factor (ECF subfamily)